MSEKIGKLIGLILADFINAWVLMLCLGVIHSKYTEVPAISYWIALMVLIAAGQFRKTDWDKD